jgi:glutathione S-transferase
MITLYKFGPAFGLTDPSPFVAKAETLLKLANLPYRTAKAQFRKAPKGKVPYIEDDGELIGDSTLIRWHLEKKYGVDFERGLSPSERATAWAFEKMAEDHLYWAAVGERWLNEANFDRGPRAFFASAPAPIRPLIIALVRRKVRRAMRAHGMGRHSKEEIAALGTRSVDAIADFLGDKKFFMGDHPFGVDATMFAFAAGGLCPLFAGPLQQAAARHDNLKRYVGRMAASFYPDFPEIAGCPAAS